MDTPDQTDPGPGSGHGVSDPVRTNPETHRTVFENDLVRVLEYYDTPGSRTSPHRHPDSVMYTLSAFRRRLHFDDGTREVSMTPGQVLSLPGPGARRREHRRNRHTGVVRRAQDVRLRAGPLHGRGAGLTAGTALGRRQVRGCESTLFEAARTSERGACRVTKAMVL